VPQPDGALRIALTAVTGATGAVGSRVARRLADAGVPLRLVVRDPARVAVAAEVRQASGYDAAEEMRAALEAVDALLLVPASEDAHRVAMHRSAVDAAVAAGVGHLVYLSFFNAAPDATFTFARDHWNTEQLVRATGVPFTFLRMNLYMDFVPALVGEDGVIRGPAGDGRVSAILRDDVAAAAAAVLTTSGHVGRTYDLTGPEAFTLAEAAQRMGTRFVDETDDEAYASRAGYGAPAFEVAGWVSTYQAIRDGSLAGVSTDVRALTGSDPVGLADYLAGG